MEPVDREQSNQGVGDVGDASVAGTFGLCVVDGHPIEAKRLESSPWVPYCLKHQKLLEAAARHRFPTM